MGGIAKFQFEILMQLLFLFVDNTDEKICLSNEHDLIYDELISIIMDHQAVMK